MDYRDLLKRYIRLINDSEGDAFMPDMIGSGRTRGGAPTVQFTASEIAELKKLEAEGAYDERIETGEEC
jgi:hypothetical protein